MNQNQTKSPTQIRKFWSKTAAWQSSRQNKRRIQRMAMTISAVEPQTVHAQPVIFFNASARLSQFSQNAAFSLLTSWGVRLAGAPVIHFVCQGGMQPCVLGTSRADTATHPPCKSCTALSEQVYAGANVTHFQYNPDRKLAELLADLSLDALGDFTYTMTLEDPDLEPPSLRCQDLDAGNAVEIPLGRLILPAARWALRQYDLDDTHENRYLLRRYILSGFSLMQQFDQLIRSSNPGTVVIFNGIMYPEACARWIAKLHNIRTITHEVGFQRFSAFFSHGEATAYPIHIPDEFELTPIQEKQLDDYLQARFQGDFTMAGIRFWPEMRGLDEQFLEKASRFRQVVPVFTNVVYDTSQVHANVVFENMFDWLEELRAVIVHHPETLFVLRAHPDEMRPGTAKQSRQSVHTWVTENGLTELPNVVFIDSLEYVSSYELILASKFVIVYNSSIGLEAVLLGKPVLCGGKARYTQYPIVFFPETREEYIKTLDEFLNTSEVILPGEYRRNARRFLHYQLFRVSIPYGEFIQPGSRAGFVTLKEFDWQELAPPQLAPPMLAPIRRKNHSALGIVVDAITGTKSDFLLLEDHAAIPDETGIREVTPESASPQSKVLETSLIELLGVQLLDENRALVEELRGLAASLNLEFGWHYLLDLTWVISKLGDVRGKRIIDAGAGTGMMQWYLASCGAEVISIDRSNRASLPVLYRKRFDARGLRSEDLMPTHRLLIHDLLGQNKTSPRQRLSRFTRDITNLMTVQHEDGHVLIYNQDLTHLPDIPSASVDAVVSISALEHNTLNGLKNVVAELERVLKPAAPLLATLTASDGEDRWHEASSGWCYSGTTLSQVFGLDPALPSNYDRYEEFMAELRECAELRDNLAAFYFKSDRNGMPWGIWDPQYLPVGVLKVVRKYSDQ